MVKTSIQQELGKVRPPRVRIAYEVMGPEGTVKKELPFVVGVLGDFTGNPLKKPPKLKDRRFIEINRDNFDNIMARMAPELNIQVPNTLEDDGTEINVNLKFSSMKDFEPARIADQVKPLKQLLEARQKLIDLKTKAQLSDDLEDRLKELLSDSAKLQQAAGQLGGGSEAAGKADESENPTE